MDFDFSQIAVPFRMQPGLRRLAGGNAQLTRLAPGSVLFDEKRRVVEGGESRLCTQGFDPGPALQAIEEEGRDVPGQSTDAALPPELRFKEDFAVLDGATGSVPWLCVCVPSHWAPEDKLGKSLGAIHGPVADNALLQTATAQLVALATSGERWERHVWTVTPSPRYDQHPRRHPRTPWPLAEDAQAFAGQCFLRAERQTFFPVGRGTRQAVFTIRVMLQPLVLAVDTQSKATRLHDSLASMTDAVLAYKGLAQARAPLLRWLRAQAA